MSFRNTSETPTALDLLRFLLPTRAIAAGAPGIPAVCVCVCVCVSVCLSVCLSVCVFVRVSVVPGVSRGFRVLRLSFGL